jgi:hypothetical protein
MKKKPKIQKLLRAIRFPLFLIVLFALGISLSPLTKNIFEHHLSYTAEQEAQRVFDTCSTSKNKENRDSFQCYSDAFYKITLKRDPDFSFDTISELQKLDESVKSCHLISHGIGWAMYDKDPDNWQDSLGQIPSLCNYGSIHGLIERYGKHGGVLDEKTLPGICGNKPSSVCIHGVGHVLTVVNDDNIEKAKKLCSSFSNEYDCLSGVYMEHMRGITLLAHGLITNDEKNNRHLRIHEYANLCNKATGDAAVACWSAIAIPSNKYFLSDPQKMLDFCNNALDIHAANMCRRNSVAITITVGNFEFPRFKYICDIKQPKDKNFKRDCYIVMVYTAVMFSTTPKDNYPIIDFCLALSSDYKILCLQTINSSFSSIDASKEYKDTVCNKFPSEYLDICRGNFQITFDGMRNNEGLLVEE